jgi:hypothetical protein
LFKSQAGPAIDKQVIENAADTLRKRGQVRFDSFVYYDDEKSAQLPGRQLQIALPDGHILNGSVYMADHRLYITEALATVNDLEALMFSQSISLIDKNGTDLDTNPVNVSTSAGGNQRRTSLASVRLLAPVPARAKIASARRFNLATNAAGTSAGLPSRKHDCTRINRPR